MNVLKNQLFDYNFILFVNQYSYYLFFSIKLIASFIKDLKFSLQAFQNNKTHNIIVGFTIVVIATGLFT